MCATLILIPEDELDRIIEALQEEMTAERIEMPPVYKTAYPKANVPVVVPNGQGLAVQVMRWGYPVSWQRGADVVYNTKMETALAPRPNMWSEAIKNRRCLVPSYGFFEPHRVNTHPSPKTGRPIKDQYCFRLPDCAVVWMAGVYEDGHFSVMTTAPNQWMEQIHPRMPVVLRPDELNVWLHGAYPTLADRSQIRLEGRKIA